MPPIKKNKKVKDEKSGQSQFDMLKMIAGDIKGNMTLEEKQEIKYVPSRLVSYNRASVFGGFPAGAIYEIHGPNGGGKTVLGIEILTAAQRAGHLTVFHDHERAANDKRWIQAIGLDLSNCLYRNKHKDGKSVLSFEDSAEEINEMIIKFNEAKLKGQIPEDVLLYILIDSVAKMVPKAKLKGQVGDANYGLTARLMSDWLQTLVALVGGSDVAVIFINQERVNIGAKPWEPKYKSFGGEALQYDASVRVRVTQAGEVKEKVNGEEIIVGRRHYFKIEKNKFGYPMQEGYFYTSNGLGESELGIDLVRTTVEEAIFQGIIVKEGSWYSVPGHSSRIQGERKVRLFLRENPEVQQLIVDTINSMIVDGSTRLTSNSGEEEEYGDEQEEQELE